MWRKGKECSKKRKRERETEMVESYFVPYHHLHPCISECVPASRRIEQTEQKKIYGGSKLYIWNGEKRGGTRWDEYFPRFSLLSAHHHHHPSVISFPINFLYRFIFSFFRVPHTHMYTTQLLKLTVETPAKSRNCIYILRSITTIIIYL